MDNNGEIRRVLGKSQKKVISNKKELELEIDNSVNEKIVENVNNTEEISKAGVVEKDAVSQLIDKNDENANVEVNGDKLLVLVPLALLIIVFVVISSYTFMTRNLVPPQNTQDNMVTINQESSFELKKNSAVSSTANNDEGNYFLSESEKQAVLNDYKREFVKQIIPNWHPEKESFLIDNNLPVDVHILKDGSIKCSGYDRDVAHFIAMQRAIGSQFKPLPDWYEEESLDFKLYFEGNEDLYWQRTKQIKPTYQVSLTPIRSTQAKSSRSTYDLVMERTSSNDVKKMEPKPVQNIQGAGQVGEQIQSSQPQLDKKEEVEKPKNQYKDKSSYLKEVKRLLSESYKPQSHVDYSKLEIDFSQGKVISREGYFSGGTFELYGYLLTNITELPIYYNNDGKACSLMVIVNNSVITDVTFVE